MLKAHLHIAVKGLTLTAEIFRMIDPSIVLFKHSVCVYKQSLIFKL